jgi:hypothetical protein
LMPHSSFGVGGKAERSYLGSIEPLREQHYAQGGLRMRRRPENGGCRVAEAGNVTYPVGIALVLQQSEPLRRRDVDSGLRGP